MVTTRSSNKQRHTEDYQEQKSLPPQRKKKSEAPKTSSNQEQSDTKSAGKDFPSPPPSPARKRKEPSTDEKKEAPVPKKVKNDDEPIIINRAPVLNLWGASVTHCLYPKLPWETCLSAGAAISAICAVAKGRSIGTLDEAEDTNDRREEKAEQKEKDYEVLEIMHFKLKLKNGKVHFGGKAQSSNEDTLRKKFGTRYEDVKTAFEDALQEWKGSEEALSKKGFEMYEDFRPNVAKGQKGWGRKGELSMKDVRKVVARE